MKTLLTITTAILFLTTASGQVYIGNSMGLGIESYTYFDAEEKVNETYRQAYIFYSMPVGWQHKNLLFESGWLYAGKIMVNGLIGYKIRLSKNKSLDLLSGIADEIDMPFKQKIILTAQGRFNWGAFYLHSNVYGDGVLAGIGLKGFILNKKKQKK